MIKFIYALFYSKSPEIILLKYLVMLGIIFALLVTYRGKVRPTQPTEGFTQSAPFVLKQNEAAYDTFYTEVYDGLNNVDKRATKEISHIIKMTEPSKANSTFLDIGSGTGSIVRQLQMSGFTAFGIDKSPNMVQYANATYKGLETICADAMDTMIFDKYTFTHVLCTHFTIYQFQDKLTLFKNCYFWMKPNAYLIMHVVDRNKFDPILPNARPSLLRRPQQFIDRRITDSIIEFDDFEYRTSYQFPKRTEDTTVSFQETFTDKFSSNIRQNEQTLYMEDISDILTLANRAGFVFHSKIEGVNDDKHQYFYILERTL